MSAAAQDRFVEGARLHGKNTLEGDGADINAAYDCGGPTSYPEAAPNPRMAA